MREHRLTLPELGLIAATRGILGFGAGLLLSEHFGRRHREMIGLVAVALGALSTIPFAVRLFRAREIRPGEGNGKRATSAPVPEAPF
jgi:hypothetical protein